MSSSPIRQPKQLNRRRKLLAGLIANLVRAYSWTWRLEFMGDVEVTRPSVVCFWHNRLMMPIALYRRCLRRGYIALPMTGMISASKDGAFLSEVIGRFGVRPIRGSSSRRGAMALIEARRALADGFCVAITPDGPRGPKCECKPGPVHLAMQSGCPVVAVTAHASRFWQLRSWDQFQIPQPFARIRIRALAPVYLEGPMDETRVHEWTARLTCLLNDDGQSGAADSPS